MSERVRSRVTSSPPVPVPRLFRFGMCHRLDTKGRCQRFCLWHRQAAQDRPGWDRQAATRPPAGRDPAKLAPDESPDTGNRTSPRSGKEALSCAGASPLFDTMQGAPSGPRKVDGRGAKPLMFYPAHANGYNLDSAYPARCGAAPLASPTPAWAEACCAYISRGGEA